MRGLRKYFSERVRNKAPSPRRQRSARQTQPSRVRASFLPPAGDIEGVKHGQVIQQARDEKKSIAILISQKLRVLGKPRIRHPAENVEQAGADVRAHWEKLNQGGDALVLSSYSKEMTPQPKAREKHCPHCTPKQDSSNPSSLDKVSQSWNGPGCHANQPCERRRLCPGGRLNLLRYQNEIPPRNVLLKVHFSNLRLFCSIL